MIWVFPEAPLVKAVATLLVLQTRQPDMPQNQRNHCQ